jgi:hypothetical protein
MIDAIQLLRIKDMGLDQWHANQPIRDANRKASLFRKKIVDSQPSRSRLPVHPARRQVSTKT